MSENPLYKELGYYKKHQQDLVEQHSGMYVVIKDEEVKGVYESEIEAYTEAQKEFELGTFLIQLVESGVDSYSQNFYSRVSI